MSDQNKFEKMLELLVNEDKAAAEELFHEIVVEKSRDIYESLLEDEAEVDEADDEEVDESDEDLDEADDEEVDESDEDLDENFSLDTFEVEADDEPFGGDKTDDLANDLGMEMPGEEGDDDMGDAEDDADVEDRVEDLEDALDDLKAEFEKMMAGDDEGEDDGEEADDDAEGDMDMDMDAEEPEEEAMAFEAADEEVDEADEEVEEDTTEKSETETMREYVEKVTATMGDNGVNGKSAVAKPNNMGGTSANIAKNGAASHPEAGAGSTVQGSALSDTSAKDMSTGNINVPGGKAAKAHKSAGAGHGAEKKGSKETADKAAGSTLNKVSTNAK
jgi:hypothetical protein